MDDKTPGELLPEFYKEYNLGTDGGQSNASVRIELTKKFSLYIPNFTVRKKAILKHDIHHIITGYHSTFKGETEIGAWEIGSGCKKYRIAFVLDISAVMAGIIFNFWSVLKAFARGRRTRNLYYEIIPDEQALDMKVSEIKRLLYLDTYPQNTKPSFIDFLLFAALALFGLIFSILSLILLPFILVYTIYIISGLNCPGRVPSAELNNS